MIGPPTPGYRTSSLAPEPQPPLTNRLTHTLSQSHTHSMFNSFHIFEDKLLGQRVFGLWHLFVSQIHSLADLPVDSSQDGEDVVVIAAGEKASGT